MPPAAKTALQRELSPVERESQTYEVIRPSGPRRSFEPPPIHVVPPPSARPKAVSFQPRMPVITGEVQFRGVVPVDGTISGQLGAGSNGLALKLRPKNGSDDSEPELDGELSFKDMLRINGHVRGKVLSAGGTLIIDNSARVDAEITVSVCIIAGIVNGDVVAYDRVELGPGAVIHGSIATRSITIKPGAVFHGECRMIKGETVA